MRSLVHLPGRVARLLVLLPLAVHAAENGVAITRYEVEHDGVILEITAPRPDVLRVRVGERQLPADESWAVPDAVRAVRNQLVVSRDADIATIRTGALAARLDTRTLALRVEDENGEVVFEDAAGGGLRFERGGYRLRKAMPPDEHYFALGDKTGPLDRRDGSFTLWNSDHFGFGPDSDPLYKSIPFVVAVTEQGRAFGWFLDDHWRTNFDFGKAERNVLEVSAEGGPVDYYVLAGPTPKSVVETYAWLVGRPPLPPLWTLGFQQSRYSYMSRAEVESVAHRLRADRIPSDVLYTDIDYQDRNRPFTVNAKAFPAIDEMVRSLRDEGFHLVMITDLHIAAAPGEGYAPYDTGIAADAFLRGADGSTFIGTVWPGKSVFPDFSRESVRRWWGSQYEVFAKLGVSGFWNDMNEPALFATRSKTMPLDVQHRIEEPGFATRTATHAEMHNVYGMLNSRATYEGLLRLRPNERPFVLTRASYSGGQRYAATWTGDNLSGWDQLNLAVSMLANLGLSGFGFAGDDIGGFAGDVPSPELMTRWIEIGAFNPIFRDHCANDKPAQEVWVGGSEHEDIRRRYIEERYRLLPYIYGLAEETSRTGLPMLRPVFLEFPQVIGQGDNLGGSALQFMLGPQLLVAPAATPESAGSYKVVLPGAGWYDYWTGRMVDGRSVTEVPALSRLPVFVRPGAIIPRQPLVQNTSVRPVGPLTLAVYPGADCEGSLYSDDGTGFDYRHGVYLRQHYSCSRHGDELEVGFSHREGSYAPWWTSIVLEVHGVVRPAIATLDGHTLPSRFDPESLTLSVELPDVPRAALVRVLTGPP